MGFPVLLSIAGAVLAIGIALAVIVRLTRRGKHPLPPRANDFEIVSWTRSGGVSNRPPPKHWTKSDPHLEILKRIHTDGYCFYSGRTVAECNCTLHSGIK